MEAVLRLISPSAVNGEVMLGIAIIGGIANLGAFLILSGASSLNERGARAHVLSDLLGSGATVAAAGVILAFGWLPADALLPMAVSVPIFRSGWRLTRDAAHIMLEGVEKQLKIIPGVAGIHHMYAWSLTGEKTMVTLHAQILEGADGKPY